MSEDGPKFLRDGNPPEMPAEPAPKPDDAKMRTELEAAIAAAHAMTAPAPRSMHCAGCGSAECAPVYALLEHSSFEMDRRYKFMRTETVVRSSLAPYVFSLCTPCYWRVDANRRRVTHARYGAIAGLSIACGYFIGALAKAPTPVVLSLLFGGAAIFALAVAVVVFSDRALAEGLRLPRLPGMQVLVLSKDRGDLDRVLERRKLISLEIQNEIDRMASNAADPPSAKLIDRGG